jgi:regulatory protein RepA
MSPVRPWLLDAAELLAEEDPGPTPYLVDGLIVERALVACVGRWKTTKSYALLHICAAVASGRPAFGSLEVAKQDKEKPWPVVFANEESGRAALWRRLDALARGSAIDPEELRGQLMVAANAGIRLDDPGWQNELVAIGKELRPRLFALDPLARMKAPALDENEQKHMAALIEFLRHLREETNATVAFVHHTGHAGGHRRPRYDRRRPPRSRRAQVRRAADA